MYICLECDLDFSSKLKLEEIICSQCNSNNCVYAITINNGYRKRWINIEKEKPWKRYKKIHRSLSNDLCKDKEYSERLEKLTDQIFNKFNTIEIEEYFPKYRVDFQRTFNKKIKMNKRDKRKKTKRGSIRGELYEGLFNRVIDSIPNIERNIEPIETPLGKFCRPDAFVSYGKKRKYPVEFKTVAKGDFVVNKMLKMLTQSRIQGNYANQAGWRNVRPDIFQVSILIVCCPEERKYSSFLIDDRIEGKISHLRGKKSQKRIKREKNKLENVKLQTLRRRERKLKKSKRL